MSISIGLEAVIKVAADRVFGETAIAVEVFGKCPQVVSCIVDTVAFQYNVRIFVQINIDFMTERQNRYFVR